MTAHRHLIVDGYNVIHGLKRFSKGSLEERRIGLERAVELLAATEGMEWTICFDGRESHRNFEAVPHLLFSEKEGADALMERLAYQAKERRELLFVTNDHTLGNFLFGLGASILSVEDFEKRVQQAERALGR